MPWCSAPVRRRHDRSSPLHRTSPPRGPPGPSHRRPLPLRVPCLPGRCSPARRSRSTSRAGPPCRSPRASPVRPPRSPRPRPWSTRRAGRPCRSRERSGGEAVLRAEHDPGAVRPLSRAPHVAREEDAETLKAFGVGSPLAKEALQARFAWLFKQDPAAQATFVELVRRLSTQLRAQPPSMSAEHDAQAGSQEGRQDRRDGHAC